MLNLTYSSNGLLFLKPYSSFSGYGLIGKKINRILDIWGKLLTGDFVGSRSSRETML